MHGVKDTTCVRSDIEALVLGYLALVANTISLCFYVAQVAPIAPTSPAGN